MTRRLTGGFQPKPGPELPPTTPSIPATGISIQTAASGDNNPLRSLGITYAKQALVAIQSKGNRDVAKRKKFDDLEIRPGVFRHAATLEKRPDYFCCMDCKAGYPLSFVVEDDVWEAAGLTTGIICYPCFEKRLGRKLTVQDLKHAPVNESIFYGYLLALERT
jgi:hypothetical protein